MSWKVGELARSTGLTVRALHHYDEIGLLRPSSRTGAGHRVYDDADVRKLYRVVALRGLGLPLEEIGRVLDGGAGGGSDLAAVIRLQLERLDEEVAAAGRLRTRLRGLLEALERSAGSPSGYEMIEAIEVMTMYYTPEQLEQLERRREALGEEGMRAGEQAWASVAAELRACMDEGVGVGDPRVQAQLDRADELLAQFTGGDPGIQAGLDRMWREQDSAELSRGLFSPELVEYMGRARAVRAGSEPGAG